MTHHIVQIGLGVVGFAYAKAFKEKGMKVTGIEYNKNLVEKYKEDFNMYHIADDLSNIYNVDFILLSICTPLNKDKTELDMTYLLNSVDNVTTILQNNPNAWVVVRSTVLPFFTKKYKKTLEDKLNMEIKIAFIPEYLRAKTAVEDATNPWQVTIGIDKGKNPESLINLYSNFIDKEKISIISIEEAELLKIFHNSFNACKISFFNQAYLLTEAINKKHNTTIDIEKITNILPYTCEGLINRKYGLKVNQAFSGFCLPKDGQELAKLEGEYNLESKLFKSVMDTNNILVNRDLQENKPEILDGPNQISFEDMSK